MQLKLACVDFHTSIDDGALYSDGGSDFGFDLVADFVDFFVDFSV